MTYPEPYPSWQLEPTRHLPVPADHHLPVPAVPPPYPVPVLVSQKSAGAAVALPCR